MRMEERLGHEEIKVLRFIARREERGDPSPGLREICCATGLEGSRTVQDRISALIRGDYLVQDVGWTRMLELTERGWRLLEDHLTSAGRGEARRIMPESPGAELLDARDGSRRRLLRVTPDSLARAGLSPEDLLVVEDDPDPDDGELVVALVGGERRIMRVRRAGGSSLVLLPAAQTTTDPADGPCVEPPLPASEAELQGRVVYVVRPLVI